MKRQKIVPVEKKITRFLWKFHRKSVILDLSQWLNFGWSERPFWNNLTGQLNGINPKNQNLRGTSVWVAVVVILISERIWITFQIRDCDLMIGHQIDNVSA